jgi:predicted GNAT superfamily acetyltransferase
MLDPSKQSEDHKRYNDYPSVFEVRGSNSSVQPMVTDLSVADEGVLVPIPQSIQRVKQTSLDLAIEWRVAVRNALTTYIDRGYEVRELLRREHYSEYVLIDLKRRT